MGLRLRFESARHRSGRAVTNRHTPVDHNYEPDSNADPRPKFHARAYYHTDSEAYKHAFPAGGIFGPTGRDFLSSAPDGAKADAV